MSAASPEAVTIITQTRVQAGAEEAFGRWQARISAVVAARPGFLEQSLLPPHSPDQVDWVILQRFQDSGSALVWLNSAERLALLAEAAPLLAGGDDVHLVTDIGDGARPAPASVVFSTRLKPGGEAAFRAWQQRVGAAQANAPGFQGYRFEPPTPGVQEDWLGILRFDSDANLQLWLGSSVRLALLKEAEAFTEAYRVRIARTGFDQWFGRGPKPAESPPAWKQNMVVLALLYPVVFLFGHWVQSPLLMGGLGWPFWFALFVGNAVSVVLLSQLVPWAGRGLHWWLGGRGERRYWAEFAGVALLVAFYAICMIVFARLSSPLA